ncbi:MAG: hypothetical protein WAJ87_20235 [Bryobacteraceae bacterium]
MNSLRLLREIVEEVSFGEQLKALGVTYQRLDDVLEGVMFALCHSPDSFEKIPGTKLRAVKTGMYPGAPSLRIYFYEGENTDIHLLSVELCEEVTPFVQYEE